MSSLLSSILGAFDIFHQKVQLNVNTRNKLSTNAGNVLTIIVVVVTLLQSFVTVSDIFNRANPALTKQQEILQDPGYLQLNSSSFVFAIGVQDAGFNLSSSYVSFQMQYRIYTRLPNGTLIKNNTKVPLKKCDLDYMRNFSADFEKLGINNALCPTLMEYDVVGTFLGDNYQFIKIAVYSCMNDTSQPDIVCKPYDEVMKALTGKTVQLQMFFSNTIFDPTNYTVPVTYYMSNLHWYTLPGQFTLNSDIFISEQVISTDDNMWFSDDNPSIITSYQIDPAEERPQSASREDVNPSNYEIANFYFRKSANKITTYRVFPKIQQGLVAIGGIFSVCVGVFGTIALFYTKQVLAVTIANEMYEFDIAKPSDKKKSGKSHFCCCKRKKKGSKTQITNLNDSMSKLNDRSRSSRKGSSSEKNGGLDFYVEKFAKYTKNNQRLLSYTFYDFVIGLLCCRRRQKDKLVSKATNMVAKDIDILQILKKLQEIDKLKKVLLDEHQNNVFSYSRPPLVTLREPQPLKKPKKKDVKNEALERLQKLTKNSASIRPRGRRSTVSISRNTQLLETQTEYDGIHKFVSLFSSYQRLLNTGNQSVLDNKILKLLDYEMDETLFNIFLEIKTNETTRKKFRAFYGAKVFGDMLEKKRQKTVMKMNKLEAGRIIARKLAEYMRRKKNPQLSRSENKSLVLSKLNSLLLPRNSSESKDSSNTESLVIEGVSAKVIGEKEPARAREGSKLSTNSDEKKPYAGPAVPIDRQKSTESPHRPRQKDSPKNFPTSDDDVPLALARKDSSSAVPLLNRSVENPKEQINRKPKRLEPIKSTTVVEKPTGHRGDSKEKDKIMQFDKFTKKEATFSVSFKSYEHLL